MSGSSVASNLSEIRRERMIITKPVPTCSNLDNLHRFNFKWLKSEGRLNCKTGRCGRHAYILTSEKSWGWILQNWYYEELYWDLVKVSVQISNRALPRLYRQYFFKKKIFFWKKGIKIGIFLLKSIQDH